MKLLKELRVYVKESDMEFDIVVKGVRYDLHAYKELRDEWDLVVNGKLVCDSKPYPECLRRFINMIEDWGDD